MFIRNIQYYLTKNSSILFKNDLIKQSRNLTINLNKKFNEQQKINLDQQSIQQQSNQIQQQQSNDTENYVTKKSNKHSKYLAKYFYNLVNQTFELKNHEQILKSKPFNEMCKSTLQLLNRNDNNQFKIVDKLSILRSLQTIGVKSNDKLICLLIDNLNSNLNELDITKTLKVLFNQIQFQESSLQKMFIQNLIKLIESRQEEINNLTSILMIYDDKLTNLFSNEFLKRVDLHALNMIKETNNENNKELTEIELTYILHKLSLSKRRPKPLIQHLVNLLNEKEFNKLSLNKVLSLINSLANLSYLSIELLNKCEDYLLKNQFLLDVNKFDFNLLIKDFIRLKYEPTNLLDHLKDNIELVNNQFGKKTLLNLINLMAYFNYSREDVNKLLQKDLFNEIDLDLINDNVLQIEYNWSLAFYDHLIKTPLDLFKHDFYSKILDKKYFFYLRPRFLLLYHYCSINFDLDIKLQSEYLQSNLPLKKNSAKIDQFKLVLKKDHYLTNVDAQLGYNFDLVFLCNKKFETKKIQNLDEAKKLCDDEFKLIYVYLVDAKEIALNTNKKLGEIEMMYKIAKQLDYKVLLLDPDFLRGASIDTIKQFQKNVIDLI